MAAFKAGDLRAARTLQLTQELYQVERRANEDGCDSHERLQRRQESSAPRMQQLRRELDSIESQAPPKTPLGVAITYALRRWDTLNLFLSDGAVRIDKNRAQLPRSSARTRRSQWERTPAHAPLVNAQTMGKVTAQRLAPGHRCSMPPLGMFARSRKWLRSRSLTRSWGSRRDGFAPLAPSRKCQRVGIQVVGWREPGRSLGFALSCGE